MLAEFVAKIVDLAKGANAIQTGTVKEIPDRVYVRHGEKMEWMDAPPPKRAHIIHSFSDLLDLIGDAAISKKPEVYHSTDKIVVLLDRDERREMVTMPLVKTDRFKLLAALGAGNQTQPAYDIAGAIRLIRFDLHGIGADSLIAALRRIDFTRKGTGSTTIEHGKESLGRQVEAAVQQADQVPERFVAEVPIYANSGLRQIKVGIECGIYLDVHAERVSIRPLADEIQGAIEAAQSRLHELLTDSVAEAPVFNGEVQLV